MTTILTTKLEAVLVLLNDIFMQSTALAMTPSRLHMHLHKKLQFLTVDTVSGRVVVIISQAVLMNRLYPGYPQSD